MKGYFLSCNSLNRPFPKECRIISKDKENALIEYEDQDGKVKKRTIPAQYAFERYQDARQYISGLYKQGHGYKW